MDERAHMMVGRDVERERIEAAVRAGAGSLVLVEGRPGIGKTTLWRCGVEAARASGMRVLEVRPAEAERTLTFAGLAQLLPDALLDEVGGGIPAARRRVLDAALLRGIWPSDSIDQVMLGLALGSVLERLAGMGPVVVAVDDLQWLDEASAGVIAFALRRVAAAPVVVLTATRPTAGSAVVGAIPEQRRIVVRPGPLSVGALGRIVALRTGSPLPRTVMTRIHAVAADNPLLAVEIARSIAARGRLPGPREPLGAPSDAAALIERRLVDVSGAARELLFVVAAMAHPTPARVERVLGDEAAALDELIVADLVRRNGELLACSHPLIGSVAYATTFPGRRRALHARIAAALDGPEEQARHRALSVAGPDEAVAVVLDEAAAMARRRGGAAAASYLAELAADLTPPQDTTALVRRELAVAECRLHAGALAEAREAARREMERLAPGPARVEALVLLARIDTERAELADARRWLQQAIEEASDDPVAAARAHVAAALQGWFDTEGERRHARAALELLGAWPSGSASGPGESRDPGTEAVALLVIADADLNDGRGPSWELLDRAVALEGRATLPLVERPTTHRANYLGHAGRHRESIAAIRSVLDTAEREGDAGIRPHLLRTLAWMELCAGRLADARRDASLAVAAARRWRSMTPTRGPLPLTRRRSWGGRTRPTPGVGTPLPVRRRWTAPGRRSGRGRRSGVRLSRATTLRRRYGGSRVPGRCWSASASASPAGTASRAISRKRSWRQARSPKRKRSRACWARRPAAAGTRGRGWWPHARLACAQPQPGARTRPGNHSRRRSPRMPTTRCRSRRDGRSSPWALRSGGRTEGATLARPSRRRWPGSPRSAPLRGRAERGRSSRRSAVGWPGRQS